MYLLFIDESGNPGPQTKNVSTQPCVILRPPTNDPGDASASPAVVGPTYLGCNAPARFLVNWSTAASSSTSTPIRLRNDLALSSVEGGPLNPERGLPRAAAPSR